MGHRGRGPCAHAVLADDGGTLHGDLPGPGGVDSRCGGGRDVPDIVVAPFLEKYGELSGQELVDAVHATTVRALETARAWVNTPVFDRSRLVFLTSGAVPAVAGSDDASPLDLVVASGV